MERAHRSREFRLDAIAACRDDVATFINDWCWTYDPRSRPRVLPFELWPKQLEWLAFVARAEAERIEAVAQKSRDVGMSWTNSAIFTHHWLFQDEWTGTFVADKEKALDQKGNRRTLMEKCRFLIWWMPRWLWPVGFNMDRHSKHLEIRNPANGSIISGEVGDNAGRGGRSSLVVVDEAAHIPRADRLDAAISANADTVLWVSSVNGNGNVFARKAQSGFHPVFTFHYRDDPRKTPEWVAQRKATTDPVTWAQEREIDFGASIANLLVPVPWLNGSRELRRRLLAPGGAHGFLRRELADQLRDELVGRYVSGAAGCSGGMDVGAGKAESVLILRCGPLLLEPIVWKDPDTTNTATAAVGEAIRAKARALYFDQPGVGFGVLATFRRLETPGLHIEGVNTGTAPTDRIWPDGSKSAERFANKRSELWWLTREGCRRAHELLLYLDDKEGGVVHPLSEVLLMCEDELTGRQLNTPTWHATDRGKVVVESKDDLSARGIASPDRADALVLSLSVPGTPLFYVGG